MQNVFSPDGSFEFEELLGGLDHPDVVPRQDAGAQEEAHVPVALQLVQAAFLPQQAAQLHSWKNKAGLTSPSLSTGWKRKTFTQRPGISIKKRGSYGIFSDSMKASAGAAWLQRLSGAAGTFLAYLLRLSHVSELL